MVTAAAAGTSTSAGTATTTMLNFDYIVNTMAGGVAEAETPECVSRQALEVVLSQAQDLFSMRERELDAYQQAQIEIDQEKEEINKEKEGFTGGDHSETGKAGTGAGVQMEKSEKKSGGVGSTTTTTTKGRKLSGRLRARNFRFLEVPVILRHACDFAFRALERAGRRGTASSTSRINWSGNPSQPLAFLLKLFLEARHPVALQAAERVVFHTMQKPQFNVYMGSKITVFCLRKRCF